MSAARVPLAEGQRRTDPEKKGRIVTLLSYVSASRSWLVKGQVGPNGAPARRSAISEFRLAAWPLVEDDQ